MKELRIGHNKNENPIFGKTNPIRPMEGSLKAISTGTNFRRAGRPAMSPPDDVSLPAVRA
jgi:hypothetical protein